MVTRWAQNPEMAGSIPVPATVAHRRTCSTGTRANAGQRDLERLIPEFRGRLTVFHTNRTAMRRGLDRFSLTSFIISIYLSAFVLTTVAYVGLTSVMPFL